MVLWRPTRPFRTNTPKRCLFSPIPYHVLSSISTPSNPINAEEADVERFYEDLQDLLELTPKQDVLFIIGDWNAKVGSQEILGSNRQIWPWSTKWSRAKASRVLPRERIGHSKHPLLTTQEKTLHMDITRWSIPKSDWLHASQLKRENFYTVSKNKTWSWLQAPYCKIHAQI